MYNLTQTTGNQSSQGRVCPTTTSVLANLRRYVGATSLRLDHAPTREAKRALQNTSVPCLSGRSRPTGLYRTYERNQHGYLFVALLYYSITKSSTLAQIRNGAFIPSQEWRRDFPRRIVKW